MATSRINDLIRELQKKAGISELIINSNDNVYVEKDGEMIRIEAKFTDDDVQNFCQEVSLHNRKPFSAEHPILDGNLPDGSRVNLIHKDYTNDSHAITIRRYSKHIRTFSETPGIFGLSEQWIEFLKVLVSARVNIVVAGGTSVGKSTFLNLLLQEISSSERVITIEDTRELQFNLPNVVRLEARSRSEGSNGLTTKDLLKNTLRMRPDRIIVGECRGAEVFDLLQAMNTGHEGSMTSLHANSPAEALLRLENLYMLSGYDLPIRALRYQISTALDFIIQLKRDKQGNRVVTQVTEVSGTEGDRILLQDIGIQKNGLLKFSGMVPSCMTKLQRSGLAKDFFAGT